MRNGAFGARTQSEKRLQGYGQAATTEATRPAASRESPTRAPVQTSVSIQQRALRRTPPLRPQRVDAVDDGETRRRERSCSALRPGRWHGVRTYPSPAYLARLGQCHRGAGAPSARGPARLVGCPGRPLALRFRGRRIGRVLRRVPGVPDATGVGRATAVRSRALGGTTGQGAVGRVRYPGPVAARGGQRAAGRAAGREHCWAGVLGTAQTPLLELRMTCPNATRQVASVRHSLTPQAQPRSHFHGRFAGFSKATGDFFHCPHMVTAAVVPRARPLWSPLLSAYSPTLWRGVATVSPCVDILVPRRVP